MCKVLNISRSAFYYRKKEREDNSLLKEDIVKIFTDSRNNYGTRKIKAKLSEIGYQVSRRKINQVMKEYGLISNYATLKYKPHKEKCNESKAQNIVNRNFSNHDKNKVIVSDLTYVRVGSKFNYICTLVDLHNREIVGFSVGANKDAELVAEAFAKINFNLSRIDIFHTDRGLEFKNTTIANTLKVFNIKHSLSMKGCPYDNAVAEATFKIIKTEFVKNNSFSTLNELSVKLSDYVNWYNNHRIHSSLGYKTPVDY